MIFQVIGVLLGVIGIAIDAPTVLIVGGVLCLVLDVLGFLSGRLKPTFPIFLYIVGCIVSRSWIGILYGAIVGNTIEILTTIFVIMTARKMMQQADQLFKTDESNQGGEIE